MRTLGPALARAEDRLGLPAGYLPCAALALVAVWEHRYPAGVDLPQHANLVRLWVSLVDGPIEYAWLYRFTPFTPYILAYAVAYPFTKWVSALVGIKVVLTLAALGTPWAMGRWLRSVGSEACLGLVGFPVVFGFAYLWGFLAHCFSLPFLFGYLASFERQGQRPRASRVVCTAVWGALLFFAHGVTFGVAVVVAAIRCLRLRRPWLVVRPALHLVPLAALSLVWLRLREARASADPKWWFIDGDRLLTVFSGLFWPKASVMWAAITVAAVVFVVLYARPHVNRSPGAWVPFGFALLGVVVLPEYIASTYLVGTRFVVYLQAFAAAIWVATSDEGRRRLEDAVLGIVVGTLVLLNVRLYRFNVELEGFSVLASHAPPFADVETFLPRLGGDSAVMGPRELSEVPAWVSAEGAGLIENDSARYFQMPVQRLFLHVRRARYVFVRGDESAVRLRMVRAFPDAVRGTRAGDWFFYERPSPHVGDLTVVRSAQEAGELAVGASFAGTPFAIGGVPHEHGLGTHARGFIRLHVPDGRSAVSGACGIDDSAPDGDVASCRIRTGAGELLWQSPRLAKGDRAATFSVSVGPDHEVIFESLADGNSAGDNLDWVDLQ